MSTDPEWTNKIYDFFLNSDPMHDNKSRLVITFISLAIVVFSILTVIKANKKTMILKESASLNPYGISVYTLRIYTFIRLYCFSNIAVCVVNVVLMWVLGTFFKHNHHANIWYSIIVGLLNQIRALFLIIVNLDILFEYISLLHLIHVEKGKDLGKLVFLAKTADSSVLEKKRIIQQEKIIERFW